ncbi:MAG: PQQ-binding-like beta-propeller repeat protein, partial [Bryobacterales bacterium]|nr:PQQ-binding-like beta-propeller repeat protein [Bryobacterales bacterium]
MKQLLVGFAAVCSALAATHDWRQFRGPDGSGVAESATPPVQWDASKIVWKAPLPGLAVSSPIVSGDRVFVTTAISGDPKQGLRMGLYGDVEPVNDATPHVWKVMAFNRATGKLVWERVAAQGVPKTKRHPKSSQASCTPVTNGKVVIAYFGSEGLY